MARKSRYREYLNAVRNVKGRTTHESIRKRLKELKQEEKRAEKQGGGSHD